MNKSKAYWEREKINYPFRTEVPHMSKEDLDPRFFQRITKEHFIRVPFEGKSYWGFKSHEALVHFQKVAGIL